MKVMISSLLGIGNQSSLTETSFVFLESRTLNMNKERVYWYHGLTNSRGMSNSSERLR